MLDKKITDVLDNNDISYKYVYTKLVNVEWQSDAGEDMVYSLSLDNFVHDFWVLSEEFDPELHVEQWIEAKNENRLVGQDDKIPGVFTLVEDAKGIQNFMNKVAGELVAVKEHSND